jgi:hypothetical protein
MMRRSFRFCQYRIEYYCFSAVLADFGAPDPVELARAAIETAATKQDPREYIGAIVRGRDDQTRRDWDPRL